MLRNTQDIIAKPQWMKEAIVKEERPECVWGRAIVPVGYGIYDKVVKEPEDAEWVSSSSLSELKSKLNTNFTAGSGGSFHRDVVAGLATRMSHGGRQAKIAAVRNLGASPTTTAGGDTVTL